MLGCCGVMFDWWYMMIELTEIFINHWASVSIGFFLGGLLMFILSCLHHAKYYDEMIDLKKELKAYEEVCDEKE